MSLLCIPVLLCSIWKIKYEHLWLLQFGNSLVARTILTGKYLVIFCSLPMAGLSIRSSVPCPNQLLEALIYTAFMHTSCFLAAMLAYKLHH